MVFKAYLPITIIVNIGKFDNVTNSYSKFKIFYVLIYIFQVWTTLRILKKESFMGQLHIGLQRNKEQWVYACCSQHLKYFCWRVKGKSNQGMLSSEQNMFYGSVAFLLPLVLFIVVFEHHIQEIFRHNLFT